MICPDNSKISEVELSSYFEKLNSKLFLIELYGSDLIDDSLTRTSNWNRKWYYINCQYQKKKLNTCVASTSFSVFVSLFCSLKQGFSKLSRCLFRTLAVAFLKLHRILNHLAWFDNSEVVNFQMYWNKVAD